jgi:orotate phosphoribosyltransferase
MSLFQGGKFRLHSGDKSSFKIECAFLSDDDWQTIARIIASTVDFKWVVGIPPGGLKLAEALKFYCKADDNLQVLIVDDVLTTGKSMEKYRARIGGYSVGIVLFARGQCPWWVIPLFEMNINFRDIRDG